MSFYGSHPQPGLTKAAIDARRRAAGLPPCRLCVYFGRVFDSHLYRCQRCSNVKWIGCQKTTNVADLIAAAGAVLDEQEVEDQGRWIVVHPSFAPVLRHTLLVHRHRAMAAAHRKRRRHQRCGAKP